MMFSKRSDADDDASVSTSDADDEVSWGLGCVYRGAESSPSRVAGGKVAATVPQVIVEGLLLEDCGSKPLEHWCIVTNEFFKISSRKVLPIGIWLLVLAIIKESPPPSPQNVRSGVHSLSPCSHVHGP
jgi:hypothetical protein